MIISYAQNAEDIILNRVFRSVPNGTYIDIGACFPEDGSVTKLFYDRGWNGINIEPHPQSFSLLAEKRPRDLNLNIAISNYNGTLKLYESSSLGETSAAYLEGASSFDVPAWTLEFLCKKHVTKEIDFLKIDVEGHEYNVLVGGNWNIFRPKIIICEVTESWSNNKRKDTIMIDDFLLKQNYLFAYFDGLNHYYVASEHKNMMADLAIQPNIVDRYITSREASYINELHKTKERLDLSEKKLNFFQPDSIETRILLFLLALKSDLRNKQSLATTRKIISKLMRIMRILKRPARIVKKVLRKSLRIIFILCKYNVRIPQKLRELHIQKSGSQYNFYSHKKKISLRASLKVLTAKVKQWPLGKRYDA